MILFSIPVKNTVLFLAILFNTISCSKIQGDKKVGDANPKDSFAHTIVTSDIKLNTGDQNEIIVAANRLETYLPLLTDKKVAVVGNQTSVIFKNNQTQKDPLPFTHIVDSLLRRNVNISKVFAPEHGFRGKQDAAEVVVDGKDAVTGLPIISLYGKNKKPTPKMMEGVDIVLFDIQDVGVRFYTYLSTLHYVMQSCAENNIPLIVLDRPNPNISYVDGPVLDPQYSSFVGMHPVPLVYGMTIGEYAQMINGENWLGGGLKCNLQVVSLKNYNRQKEYHVPIRPSPNLPNDQSIMLYPSLGLFEGTTVNAGRGTEMQFQIFGSPYLPKEIYSFTYTPEPNFGSKNPKYKSKNCFGKDLRKTERVRKVDLTWLMDAYKHSTNKKDFFNTASFTIHAGTKELQKNIVDGVSLKEIEKTWQADLKSFKKIREKYLLY